MMESLTNEVYNKALGLINEVSFIWNYCTPTHKKNLQRFLNTYQDLVSFVDLASLEKPLQVFFFVRTRFILDVFLYCSCLL